MTFLPIVDRELRVASRRLGTFWSRLGVASLAILIGAIIFLVNFGAAPATIGKYIFIGLAILSFVYCLFAGRRFTADCLSEEKREGTLGLLFLTDLKGYDVVLGKLVATSINAFYGLLAVFPVLAIPLLMGGVSNGEFWRVVLVLLVTFLFSLAIGIFSSACNRDLRNTMAYNFLLLWFFALLLPGCDLAIAFSSPSNHFVPRASFFCPGYALYLCPDVAYRVVPAQFWISVGIIHGLTWLFLLMAAHIVPHSWQDRPLATRAFKARWRAFWHAWNFGRAGERAAYRKKLLDQNAFYWLAARARLKPLHVWVFMVLIGCWWLGGRIFADRYWLDESVSITLALMLNTTLKLWVIIESTQRIAEDKKMGALELILSTPLGIRDIVRGQFLALRRQFLAPLIAVLALELFLTYRSVQLAFGDEIHELPTIWLAGIFMLLADLVALVWVGMARALATKSHHQAILSTMARILLLPWIGYGLVLAISGLWAVLSNMLPGSSWNPSWRVFLAWWFGLGITADLAFGLAARRQVLNQMRNTATLRFVTPAARESWFGRRAKPAAAQPALAPTTAPVRAPTKKKVRLLRWAFALVLMCLCAGYFLRNKPPKFPPPVIVPVSLSQGSLRVYPNQVGALFILPDGSLWRWGQCGVMPKAQMPEPYGANHGWVQAEAGYGDCVALRADGTIWAQRPANQPAGPSTAEFNQIDPGHDWVDVTSDGNHGFAIKKNGTLWRWGRMLNGRNQSALGTNSFPTNLTQFGTDSDWAMVHCRGAGTLAIKTNGTLWAWGQTYFVMSAFAGYQSSIRLPAPTQVCSETNWLEFVPGLNVQVRNRSGEIWDPFAGPPDASVGALANCHLFASNALPHHIALTYYGNPTIYEIHADGTLWQKNSSASVNAFPVNNAGTIGAWQQIGKRSDWDSLWSSGDLAFGLTSDGTLWTWGVDPTADAPVGFFTKIRLIQARWSAGVQPSARIRSVSPLPVYQTEPRPLLRLTAPN